MKFAAGFCGGIVLASLAAFLVTLLTADLSPPDYLAWLVFFVSYGAGLFVAFRAPSTRKAWQRLLAMCGVLSCAVGATIFALAKIAQNAGRPAGPFMGGMGFIDGFDMIALIMLGLTLGAGAMFLRGDRP